jgi:RHS repeat-associated protein
MNDLRFPGQYYDEETGLHYNLNRTYNTGLGRYIEADPLGLTGVSP